MRLTVAQALVRFLAVQYSERDSERQRLIPGCFGIFGHGIVAGVGQALLLPGDVFATRAAGALLQELELPGEPGTSVNDAFRPVSKFFARIERPEQLPQALLGAMRTLTDPAETGAVTLALPQDVQAEA